MIKLIKRRQTNGKIKRCEKDAKKKPSKTAKEKKEAKK